MKRCILILILIAALLTGAVSAAFDSPDFDGGMISGIYLDGDTLYATDVQNKVVWRVENGEAEVFAGDRTYRDINGIVKTISTALWTRLVLWNPGPSSPSWTAGR